MALEAHGARFFWSTSTVKATGASLNRLPELISYSGPSGGAAVIDITHFDSAAHEKLQGLPDEGNITLETNLTSAISETTGCLAKIRKMRDARQVGHLTLKYSTDTIIQALGYIISLTPSGAVDDKIGLSIVVEITGKATWTTV